MKLANALSGLVLLVAASAAMGEDDFGILNQSAPEQGVLFGGQPTVAQLTALEPDGGGFKTIIDLRGREEDRGFDEASVVAETGMRYVPLPVTSETLAQNATFERFFSIFEGAERPVLVHCASGNRVGALYYAWLVAKQGMSRDMALETAIESGLRNMELVEPVNRFLDSR